MSLLTIAGSAGHSDAGCRCVDGLPPCRLASGHGVAAVADSPYLRTKRRREAR